mgnify:CR=1 FL=1
MRFNKNFKKWNLKNRKRTLNMALQKVEYNYCIGSGLNLLTYKFKYTSNLISSK